MTNNKYTTDTGESKVTLGDFTGILSHLWRGAPFGHYWTLDTYSSNWVEVNGTVPGYPERWSDQNVYFGVNPCISIPPTNTNGEPKPPEQVRSQLSYIGAINALFAEFDAKDTVLASEYLPFLPKDFEQLKGRAKGSAIKKAQKAAMVEDLAKYKARCWDNIESFPLATTLIVDSGAGFQCYWFLKEAVTLTTDNRGKVAALLDAWVDLVNGDSGAKDLARVLRVPGSRNMKPEYKPLNYPEVTIVEYHPDRLYILDDFLAHTGEVKEVPPAEGVNFSAGDLPKPDISRLPKWLQDKLDIVGDDRSEHNWGVVRELIRHRFTDDEILAVFYNFPIGYEGKFAERGEPYLAKTISRARASLGNEGVSGEGWKVYSLRDAYTERPPIRYAVDELIALPSLNIFFGAPGSLKSLLTQDMLACVVAGEDWLTAESRLAMGEEKKAGDVFKTLKAPVLWIDMDNGRDRTHEHIEAVSKARDLPVDSPFHYVSMPDPWPDFSDRKGTIEAAKQIKALGAKVVVLDTLTHITGNVNLNDSMMAVVMANLRRLAEDCDCAIIVIHHQRKSNGNDLARKGESILGHTSIEAALDLALHIERKENEPALTATTAKVRGHVRTNSFGAVFSFAHKPSSKDLAKASFSAFVPLTAKEMRLKLIEEAVLETLADGQRYKKMALVDRVRGDWTKEGKAPPKDDVSKVIALLAKAGQIHREVMENERGKPEHYWRDICLEPQSEQIKTNPNK